MANSLYGSEYETIFSQMKRKLNITEMWYYREILGIPWKEKERNEDNGKKEECYSESGRENWIF